MYHLITKTMTNETIDLRTCPPDLATRILYDISSLHLAPEGLALKEKNGWASSKEEVIKALRHPLLNRMRIARCGSDLVHYRDAMDSARRVLGL